MGLRWEPTKDYARGLKRKRLTEEAIRGDDVGGAGEGREEKEGADGSNQRTIHGGSRKIVCTNLPLRTHIF